MNALKTAGLTVAALVALAILAAAALLLLADPNRHRAAIEARVRQATGRPFALAGAIKLEFFPWLALDVGQVTLGNPAGFGNEPLLTADRARIGARLLPLLRGRLEVSRVALDGLTVNLVRRADGHTNWEDLGHAASATGAGGSHGLAEISVAGLDISHAMLTLRDDGKGTLTRMSDLELHAGALGAASRTDLALVGRLDSGDGTAATRVELRTRAMLDAEHSRATLAEVKLGGERTPVAAGAKPIPFSVSAPAVSFDWSAGTLAPTTLAIRLGELALTAEVSGEQLFGARLLKGRVRAAELSPRKVAPSLGWSVPTTRDPNAFTRLGGSAGFSLGERALALEELDLTLDRTRLRGTVSVADLTAPVVAIELHADTIDFDGYRAPPGPAAAGKPAAAAPLPVAGLRAIKAHGSVVVDHATVAGLALTDLRVPFSALAGDMRMSPSVKAFGGTGAAEVRLDAAHQPASLGMTASIHGVDIGAAIKAYANSDRLSGRADAEAKLSGNGATDAALIAALAGPVDFEVKNGALEGVDFAYEIERAQAVLRGQVPPARGGPPRTPFNVLSAHSRLDHGVLASDPLRIETQPLKVSGKGTFRLADQAVDYQLKALLVEVPPNLASLKSAEIPIAVTGTVHDYKVRPDLAGIVKGGLKQEVQKRLQDLLKGLIPH
jgi:AsmA protein